MGDGVNGAIQVTNDLAQATDTNMNDTARVVTDVMHEYGISGGQLRGVANIISGALHSSSESMQDFYMSMKQVGPVASSMHQSVDDVSTTLAMLAQRGITGSQAGTAVKNMLLGLEPHTAKAAALMNDLGVSTQNGAVDSFYQLDGTLKPMPDIIDILNQKFGGLNDRQKEAALATTFTKYGLAGLNVVVGESRDKFLAFQNDLKQEDAASIAREKMNNLQGDMLRLNAATSTLSKSFGETLQAPMRAIAQAALAIVNGFNRLSPTTKEVIMIVGGLLSAMTVIGGAILTVVSAIGFLEMGLAGLEISLGAILGPVGIVVGAVALLGFAIFEAWKHWDVVGAFLKKWGTDLLLLLGPIGSLAKFVIDHWSEVKQISIEVWDAISNAIKEAWAYISPTIIGAVTKIHDFWSSVWPEIKEIFRSAFAWMEVILGPILAALYVGISAWLGFVIGIWSNSWGTIKATIKLIWDGIVDILRITFDLISGAVKVFLDILSGHWDQAGKDAITAWNKIGQDILKFFTDLANNALEWGKNFVQMFISGIEGMIHNVEAAAGNVANAVKKFLGFHSPTEDGPAADSNTWAPNFVNMFASGLSAGANQVGQAAQTMIQPLSDVMNGLGGGGGVPGGFSNDQLAMQRDLAAKIIQQKQTWEQASKNGDQAAMDSANKMADQYRAQLDKMGGDSKKFSADTSVQDAIKNVQQIAQQIAAQISTDYHGMTTSISDNLKTVSTDTSTYNMQMLKSWTDSNMKTSDSVVSTNKIISDSMMQLNATIKDLAQQMAQSMEIAFDSIISNAQRMSEQVITAANAAKQALAGLPGSNVSVNSSVTQTVASSGSSSVPFGAAPLMVAMPNNANRGGDVHFHGDININGANKNGGQLAGDIMRSLKQQMSFAL